MSAEVATRPLASSSQELLQAIEELRIACMEISDVSLQTKLLEKLKNVEQKAAWAIAETVGETARCISEALGRA